MSQVTDTGIRQRVLEDFKRDGIATVDFRDLFGEELWEAAKADIAPFVEETAARDFGDRPAGKSEVIIRRMGDRDEKTQYTIGDPWIRIAASDAMLDVVNGYTGTPSWLFYVDNWFTVPYPAADERVASQRWHRDPADEHIVKVFVYFSDVDEGAGPFEYLRSSAAGGRYGDLFAWRDGHRYVPTEDLEAAVDPEDHLVLTGPAGTVVFADTAGFHRGGFAHTNPRILSVTTFLRPNVDKGKRRLEVDFEGREAELSEQARAALV